jgi:hypothetical protein
VVVEIGEYERLLEEVELLRDIRTAEQQLAEGQEIAQVDARAQVLSRLGR